MRSLTVALSLLLTAAVAVAANDLTGVVVSSAGGSLAGAHIYIYTAAPRVGFATVCPSCYRDCGKHVAAGAKGSFRVPALDSSLIFDILAVADGYEPAFTRGVDPSRGPVTITLNPLSEADAQRLIKGIVVDPQGRLVVGAKVEPNGYHLISRRADGRLIGSVGYGDLPGLDKLSVTNERGEFALRMPEADGKLDVRVTARSLAPAIEPMLRPGNVTTIRLTEGAAITGRVMKNGRSVSGVRIGFVQPPGPSGDYLGRFEIATNEAGAFAITNLASDHSYVVYVPMESLSGGAVEPKIVRVGGDKTAADAGTLKVGPGRCVRGSVVGLDSVPPHTMVTVTTAYGDQRSVELRADHTFEFDSVPEGGARVTATLPGMRRPAKAVLPADGDVEDVRLALE